MVSVLDYMDIGLRIQLCLWEIYTSHTEQIAVNSHTE
jgi:hypothetical protein